MMALRCPKCNSYDINKGELKSFRCESCKLELEMYEVQFILASRIETIFNLIAKSSNEQHIVS